MKRYLLFICPLHFSIGGMNDLYSTYGVLEDAKEAALKLFKAAEQEVAIESEAYVYREDLLHSNAHIFDSVKKVVITSFHPYVKVWVDGLYCDETNFPEEERF